MRNSALAIIIACLTCVSVAHAQPTVSPMEHGRVVAHEVRAASLALDDALERRDTAALAKIYANGYVHIDQFGVRSTKQQRLAELGSGTRQVQSSGQIDELRMEVFGEVVVSTARTLGRQTLNGRTVGGGPKLSTRVWVHQAGRWQVILAQVTPIAPH